VLLDHLVKLVNLVHLDSLEPLDQREIWAPLDLRVVLVCKDLEETRVNLVTLDSQEKWDHLEKMA
jgi:hypothetical protein